ncbi:AGAP002411-PC [Anopheles gambiae str. PEST]|uniref:AGAP002411-PC n=1 Tax=Anopheles gambiae TaxID=7165 RepID=F5HK57_ANOGA|nr:AGAP002411-PC [Anopheles gambiae str. PEST]
MANSSETGTIVKDPPTAHTGPDSGPPSASEITIIMRTVVSSPGSDRTASAKNESALKRNETAALDAALHHLPGNRIEVTTSVRTVFECPAAAAADLGTAGSSGAATAISSLLQPVLSKNFIALLKSANDSSFENVLEFKSLLGAPAAPAGRSCPSCEHSKHALSSDSDTTANDLDASVQKKVKTEEQHAAKAHVCEDDRGGFAQRTTSTPIKIRLAGGGDAKAEAQPRYDAEDEEAENYRLNLLTPPADASFIDSDFESMEQDQYDTCSSKSSPRPDHRQPDRLLFGEPTSHPRDSVVSMEVAALSTAHSHRGPSTGDINCPLAKSSARKASSSTKAFFEEALRTPLAIRKHFQRRRNSELPKQPSHGNLLNFFSAKKKSNSLEGGLKSPRAKRSLTTTTTTTTTSENSSENGSRCTSPALTEDNLRRLSVSFVRRESDSLNRTLVWGENYDYSYECEPSHSDVEEAEEPEDERNNDDENDDAKHSPLVGTIGNGRTTERRVSAKLVHFEISPDCSYELQPPILPSFRIDPPRASSISTCGSTTTTTGLAGLIIGAAAFATATTTASFLKRSASEPAHCNKLRSHSCTPLTSDIGESDEEGDDTLEGEEEQGRRNVRPADEAEDVPMMMCKALVPQRPFTSVHQASVRSLDKIGGKTINHSASPFRRWGQSSLRSRSTEHRTPTNGSARRPSSLAASESDVYTKSIDDDHSSTKSGYNPYTGGGSAGGGVDTLSAESATIAAGPMGTAGTGGSGGTTTGPTGVASWGTSFEKLLEDAAGLHTFSEFLKKEFSAENIYFWTACERYRQLTEREERAREAQAIFARHLESGCSEPVNVDSIARNIALENLPQAEPTLFAAAQKQIFNLMKFDSYQRFIKSDLYRVCQEAEGKGQGLPYPGEQLDPMLRTSATMLTASGTGTAASITKLKKSLSNAEDRRRKSLLPWHRKTRCKSKDRGDSDTSKKDSKEKGGGSGGGGGGEKASGTTATGSSSNTLKLLSTNSTSDIHSSRSSLASFDAAIGGKSCDPDDSRNTLCRVILSNGATTVVQTRSNETIKELVERLLEKRGIVYNAYEAFLAGSTKPLDLDGPSVSLAGKEVNIDQRVVFKLNLPNRKMISVKSKAAKPLADVLRPILHKYNYELDEMKVVVHSTVDVCLDMTQPVTTVDGLCLYIRSANETPNVHPELGRPLAGARPVINTATHQQIVHHFQQQQQQQLLQLQNGPQSSAAGQQQHTFAVPSALPPSYAVATNSKSQQLLGNGTAASATCNNNTVNQTQSRAKEQSEQQSKDDQQQQQQAGVGAGTRGQQELNSLDEITNKVFDELRNGKTAFGGVVTAVGKGPGTVDVDCASDTSSTRRDRFRRRGSNAAPSESGRGAKSKKCSTGGSEDGGESVNNLGIKKPIIAKLKAGVKLQIPTRSQNDELLEGLKRAQRSRLEDQRGTEINFELPDFLKDKENFSTSSAAVSSSAGSIGPSAAPSSAAGPSKLTRSKPARRSEATTPTAEFVGGSLQQINKPQPAPRLSITGQQGRQNLSGPGSPVHAAVSDSHLNLSTQCNASPLPQDDPFHVHGGGSGTNGGSQSETSYADTTLVFTHARPYNGQALVTATPRTIPSSSASQHYSGDHSSDSSSTADGPDLPNLACCEHHPHEMSPDSSSPPTHANHLHPLHYHPAGAGASGANGAAGATPNGNTSTNNPYPLAVHYPSHHHHHPHLHPHHHPHGQHYHHHHHHTHNGGGGYQTATSQPVANGSNATAAPGQDGQPNAISGGAPDSQKGPPPLPPKPKILPIKPSNWGHPVAASYAPGPPGSAGAPSGASELLGGLSTNTLSTNGSMGGSVNGTGATVGGLSPSSSTVSSHHPNSNSNGVGVGTVVGSSNGIVSSTTHNDLSRGGREGNRQQRASSGNDGGSSNGSASAISVAVAQARNVYFDQGNSSFV